MRVLFFGVALGTTGFVAAVTVAPLVGEDLSRSATLSGLPWTAGVIGTALGSAFLSQLMSRRGRGPGLALGYALTALGALFAVVSIANGWFAPFAVAVLLMGAGNAANHLSRYAAADLYPSDRRASGLGTVVWAGTIGGVAGPALLDPSARLAVGVHLPRLAGPFLIAVVACTASWLAIVGLQRTTPSALRAHDDDSVRPATTVLEMLRGSRVRIAMLSLAAAQAVMVLIMAMTPLHLRAHGHGLGSVGLVIGVHVFGMYGLSPISGRLTDRFGATPVILGGFAILMAAAVLAAVMPEHSGSWLAVPLFLLGWGWSLAFVAGSALLSQGLAYQDRARLQGATDTVVWSAAAVAGLGSGVLVGVFGYAVLCLVGALLIALPLVVVAVSPRPARSPAPAS